MAIYDLRVCDVKNPLHAGEELTFSYKSGKIAPSGTLVTVVNSEGEVMWRSGWLDGKTLSGNTVHCSWKPQPLTRYGFYVTLKRIDGSKEQSDVSYFETGFFDHTLGGAKWVLPADERDQSLIFKTAELGLCDRVRLYVSACGFALPCINGKPVAPEDRLSPVFSDYHERDMEAAKPLYPVRDKFSGYTHYYNAYDVSELVKSGENVISMLLAGGWYAQDQRNIEGHFRYGAPKVKFCLIGFDYDGNECVRIISDEACRFEESPIVSSNIFYGEVRDGALGDGMLPGSEGEFCKIAPDFDSVLRPQFCPPDRVRCEIAPVKLWERDGIALYDKGVNGSGCAKITTSAPAGTKIVMKFAEILGADGMLDFSTAGGNGQIQSDTYICGGGKGEAFAPTFCVHGYRYFTVEGSIDSVVCEEIHTDVKECFSFSCSDEVLTGIVEMYRRAQYANMHTGIPSDCPHRERLGYTGDGQLAVSSAVLLGEERAFWRKWLRDICDGQNPDNGHVQHTAPFYGGGGGPGAWGGAIVYVPWKLYLHYGDTSFLTDYYPNMCKWADYMLSRSTNYIVDHEEEGGWCLGDWCCDGGVKLSEAYVNSCLFAEQLIIMNKIAGKLCLPRDATKWAELAERVRMAVRVRFFDRGCWDCNAQGSDALAVIAGIDSVGAIAGRLAAYEKAPLDTGIVGTPALLETLFDAGMPDIAVGLLCRREYPSFGWMMDQGATTLCEDFHMKSSHNHPMFGAFVHVIARRMMGLAPVDDDPGYDTLLVAPQFPTQLDYAEMTIDTPHGKVSSHWYRDGEKVHLELTTPSDMKLRLRLPRECVCKVNRT